MMTFICHLIIETLQKKFNSILFLECYLIVQHRTLFILTAEIYKQLEYSEYKVSVQATEEKH